MNHFCVNLLRRCLINEICLTAEQTRGKMFRLLRGRAHVCVCVCEMWPIALLSTTTAQCSFDYTSSDTHTHTHTHRLEHRWLTRRTSMINVYCRRSVSHRWRGDSVSNTLQINWVTLSLPTHTHTHTHTHTLNRVCMCVKVKQTSSALDFLWEIGEQVQLRSPRASESARLMMKQNEISVIDRKQVPKKKKKKKKFRGADCDKDVLYRKQSVRAEELERWKLEIGWKMEDWQVGGKGAWVCSQTSSILDEQKAAWRAEREWKAQKKKKKKNRKKNNGWPGIFEQGAWPGAAPITQKYGNWTGMAGKNQTTFTDVCSLRKSSLSFF